MAEILALGTNPGEKFRNYHLKQQIQMGVLDFLCFLKISGERFIFKKKNIPGE